MNMFVSFVVQLDEIGRFQCKIIGYAITDPDDGGCIAFRNRMNMGREQKQNEHND